MVIKTKYQFYFHVLPIKQGGSSYNWEISLGLPWNKVIGSNPIHSSRGKWMFIPKNVALQVLTHTHVSSRIKLDFTYYLFRIKCDYFGKKVVFAMQALYSPYTA